ncbi:DUF1643 domain-containing protein [Bacillus safensis]|uniref:DUF1643 domain-containing protein n=1 Tax=Bacillus safensis TaxID=561879 RepID=UPI00227EA5A7|nr:DUF1643 domain-containing protein [Bacillus safensis]MCY7542403.1 DUF1643 domain-containing protein [Bacillus safensis]MCY7552264.1 DUF1643 domain-containing protein [Bacillus safensis]MCY7644709.1 DUF1643 domain-containing protein [Bacillus safensis]MCY7655976.1 DUF1643 domain-containing protein [Bacillus safensis]MEC3710451.1 DUF1643 domain-containing protein [Bacillus safensis]
MTIQYPACIDRDEDNNYKISCDCKNTELSFNNEKVKVRYKLTVCYKEKPINDGSEEIIVLLKNPSKANQEDSDRTINKVIKIFDTDTGKVSKLTFLNVFPFYVTDSRQLSPFDKDLIKNDKDKYEEFLKENLKVIKDTLFNSAESKTLICAYGKGVGNKQNLKNVEDLLKKYPSDKLKSFNTDESVPLHPQRLPIDPEKPYKEFKIKNKKDKAKK